MTTAIRKHLRDFIAIIGLVVIATIVGSYILAHQRIYVPPWVPLIGREEFILKGEFITAQAITPGQGQTVNIAGVQVGEISNVELNGGRAIVTMRIAKRHGEIYPDATMLLRPKTGLKDMVVQLDPGNPSSGPRLRDGDTLPVSNTQPDVNFDEILAVLDKDTRDYIELLLHGAAVGLTDNGRELGQIFRRFGPLAEKGRRATRLLVQRRRHIRRAMTNLGKFTKALNTSDQQLMEFVDSSQAVFKRFAAQSDRIEQMVAKFPGALEQTERTMIETEQFADAAGGALGELLPFARALAPALQSTRPFMRETTPIFRDRIGPFTRDARPVIETLLPAVRDLAAATPDLEVGFTVFNRFFNALAYNPAGRAEGFLFYLTWLGHLTNSALSTQDGMGAMLRSALYINCGNSSVLKNIKGSTDPGAAALTLAAQLANLPDDAPFCQTRAEGGR